MHTDEHVTKADQADSHGLSEKKGWKKWRKPQRIFAVTSLLVCVLLAALFFGVRFSPATAAFISDIPGLAKLVEEIREDDWLRQAAKHGMIQEVGVSAEVGEVRLRIDEMLADQRRMLIFYTITHEQPNHELSLRSVELLDPSAGKLEAAISWGYSMNQYGEARDRIEVSLYGEQELPDSLLVRGIVEVDQVAMDTPVELAIPIDKERAMINKEIIYPVNQEVTVDEQRFTVERITAFPTQTEVSIRFDPANTKKIFGFDQLRLVDQDGKSYAFWGNGVPERDDGEDGVIYHLESIYFTNPDELVLQADGIRALDKEKLEVVIDAASGTFQKKPDDRLHLRDLRLAEDVVGIDYSLTMAAADSKQFYNLFSELRDDQGNEYESVSSSASSDYQSDNRHLYSDTFRRISPHNPPGELRFTLTNYPTRLSEGFRVQIQ